MGLIVHHAVQRECSSRPTSASLTCSALDSSPRHYSRRKKPIWRDYHASTTGWANFTERRSKYNFQLWNLRLQDQVEPTGDEDQLIDVDGSYASSWESADLGGFRKAESYEEVSYNNVPPPQELIGKRNSRKTKVIIAGTSLTICSPYVHKNLAI